MTTGEYIEIDKYLLSERCKGGTELSGGNKENMSLLKALAFASIFLLFLAATGSGFSFNDLVGKAADSLTSNLEKFYSNEVTIGSSSYELSQLPFIGDMKDATDTLKGFGAAIETARVDPTPENCAEIPQLDRVIQGLIKVPIEGATNVWNVAVFTGALLGSMKLESGRITLDSNGDAALQTGLDNYVVVNKLVDDATGPVARFLGKIAKLGLSEYYSDIRSAVIAEDYSKVIPPPTFITGFFTGDFSKMIIPLLPPPSSDMLNHEGPEGSDISDIGSLTGEDSSGSSSSSPSTPPSITPPPGSTQVMVNIWIHCSDKPNLPAKGTKVTAIDGAGNAIQVELDSNGKATVYGAPGTWTITAKATMYKSNPWSVEVPIGSVGDADIYQKFSPPIWSEGSPVAGVGTLV